MYGVKNSLAALAGVLMLVACFAVLTPLVSQGQRGRDDAPGLHGQPKYYLTNTLHDGSQALSACGEGYHMASLWEILDPSNLKYNTQLGHTEDDSGFGPPITFGWIRTGTFANTISGEPGNGNCQAWTGLNGHGTLVTLYPGWKATSPSVNFPWLALSRECTQAHRVWCVQD